MSDVSISDYRQKVLLVFGTMCLILFYRWLSDSLFTGWESPPYIFKEKDIAYHWFVASGLPQWLTNSRWISVLADMSLFTLPILFIINGHRLFIGVFTILLLCYFMTWNVITGHHYHSLTGALIICIPFWFRKKEKFNLAWELARYYLLYIFTSAALWKLSRGSAFYELQMVEILKSQHVQLFLEQPDSIQAKLIRYLIANPSLAHSFLLGAVLMQLTFSIGFFTRKWDETLFGLSILFCIANYIIMGIFSFELLILNATLLNYPLFKNKSASNNVT